MSAPQPATDVAPILTVRGVSITFPGAVNALQLFINSLSAEDQEQVADFKRACIHGLFLLLVSGPLSASRFGEPIIPKYQRAVVE